MCADPGPEHRVVPARGDGMDETERPTGGCALLPPEEDHAVMPRRGPHIVTYCVLSGVIAAAAGVGASLGVAGAARIGAWAAVIVAVSVVAGLAYDSIPLTAFWSASRNLFRR